MDTPEYQLKLEQELKQLRYTFNHTLKHLNKEKLPTAKFHQRCNLTLNDPSLIPQDFPYQLKVAKTPQQAIMFSNMAKSAILYSQNYNKELNWIQTKAPFTLFKYYYLDTLTYLEQRIELFTYLNQLISKRGKRNELY